MSCLSCFIYGLSYITFCFYWIFQKIFFFKWRNFLHHDSNKIQLLVILIIIGNYFIPFFLNSSFLEPTYFLFGLIALCILGFLFIGVLAIYTKSCIACLPFLIFILIFLIAIFKWLPQKGNMRLYFALSHVGSLVDIEF